MSATDQRGSAGTLDAVAHDGVAVPMAGVGEVPFRAIVEGMLEGVALLDHEWRFLYVNEAGARNLGGAREELLGQSVFDHYPGLRGSPVHDRFARCLEDRQPQRFEASFPGGDGSTHWFEFSVQPSSEGVLVLSLDVTDRHEAADADARLRAALESIDLVAVILDQAGRLAFANEALLRATGWSKEEVLGGEWFDRFVPEDIRTSEREAFDAAVRTGEAPGHHEHDLVTRGGQRRTIVWSVSVLHDRSGAVTVVAEVGDDVTDRRALERTFRETSRSVSAALNASEDSIAIYRPVLDADGTFSDAEIVFANLATGRWLPQVDLDEARGHRLFELAPEARPLVSELYATVVETGRTVHVVRESKILPVPLTLDITVTPYEDGFVHVARDVTELHRTTAELRDREEELRRTLGAVDAIIAWTIREDAVLMVSPQVERILGWRPEELTTFRAWNALVHPDDLAVCRAAWDAYDDAWRLQYRIRRVDGTYATVDDRGRRYISVGGEQSTFGVIVDVSGRVAADAALADSEERLRQIVEGVEAIVGFQASMGGTLELSPQVERILGWRPDQVPDFAAWRALIHPDDLAACVEVWDQDPPAWQLEYRARRADGTWAWLVDRGRKETRKDGSGAYMFGVMVDATERHRADEALRESEERQRRTIESLDGIVAIQEHAAAPMICSPQMGPILGVDPATVTSLAAWRSLVHPDDLPRCLALWEERPEQWEIEYRMRRPDGRDVWVLDRGRRIPREDGLGEGTFGIIVDVTDRHAAAEALRASEEQLRRMVEGVDVMISYQEAEDGPVVISPQTERILGLPPERMAKFDEWRAAIHPDDLPACVAVWDSGSPGWDMEYRMRRADGAWIWVNDRGRRIPRADRKRGLFAVITDITAQHEAGVLLRRSEARFRAMFEENPEAIGVLRPLFAPDGHFLDAEFLAANRTTRERWLGGVPLELVPGTRASGLWFTGGEEVRSAVAHVAEQGGPWRGEVRTRREGVEYWSDLSVFPFEAGVAFVGRDVTEQKRSELAVRDSEARFRAVTDSAADAIVTIDGDGTIVGWNPSAERLFGRPAGSLAGQAVTALMPNAYVESHVKRSLGFGEGGPIRGHLSQIEGQRADGTTFPIEISLAGWTVEGKRYATAIIRDVTERRTAEEAVRVATARLRRFLDAGIIGTLVADPSGRVLDANDYWLTLVGRTREQLERGDVDWRAVTVPEDLAADERAIDQVRVSGASLPYEKAYLSGDGRRVPVLVTLTTMPGPGEQIGMLVLDMTERHEAAAGLAQLAAFQRSVLDAMAEGMAIVGPDGRVTSANARASVVLGLDPADLTGQPVTLGVGAQRADGTALPPEEAPEIRTLRDGESCRDVELNVARPDGKRVWLRVNTEPLRDRDGQVIAAVATFADITAERELGEQLRRSQRLEAVGQLAGGVAHDFNNLLAAIRGYSELAMGGLPLGSPSRADLEEVLRAADRAAALTRQLLLFSRRQVLAPKLVDPADVVDGLFPMLRQLVGEHIELVAVTDHERGLVLADRGQLEQVILNLVVNARDAMPGGGRIEVTTRRTDPGASAPGETRPAWPALRIMVADTGSGIDAEVLPHIFEPFFTTKEAGRGSGMGLATVYGIVGASGGTVSVATTPAQGTTFTIDLPLVEVEVEDRGGRGGCRRSDRRLGDGGDWPGGRAARQRAPRRGRSGRACAARPDARLDRLAGGRAVVGQRCARRGRGGRAGGARPAGHRCPDARHPGARPRSTAPHHLVATAGAVHHGAR